MDKSFLVIVDDFSERVLDYSNVSLIDYGYEDITTYYDDGYNGYGNFDSYYQDIRDTVPGFALVTPDAEGYSNSLDSDLIDSGSYTDFYGYTGQYYQFYEFHRVDQTDGLAQIMGIGWLKPYTKHLMTPAEPNSYASMLTP